MSLFSSTTIDSAIIDNSTIQLPQQHLTSVIKIELFTSQPSSKIVLSINTALIALLYFFKVTPLCITL